MRILSIDFDYFQNVTAKQLTSMYPDGIDYPTFVSEVVWSGYYKKGSDKKMREIGILYEELEMLKGIIAVQEASIPVMATRSHNDIYDCFLGGKIICGKEPLEIINIDMHHDMFNSNKRTSDCGNWAGQILKERRQLGLETEIIWVANPIYPEIFDEGIIRKTGFKEGSTLLKSISEIPNEKCSFDMVFLCRSDTWTAPHLDCYFKELLEFMLVVFDEIKASNEIMQERSQYLEIAERLDEMYAAAEKHKRK